MAWSFTNLKYGWRYVVGISLAATTIYVANNTRWRINQADDIELDLAVAERCLATQYGTNAAGEPLYRVVPPEYVRSWYSNSYVTTNVPGDAVTNWTAQLHTNIYTNTVGWRTDRAKAVSRDAKIKALCPYYVDTDSVYDGTTNIIMHTFTGLLTSLDLGDHTNFTAIPAIGTNIATYGPWAWRNYVVAWQERYKVLEALKMTKVNGVNTNGRSAYGWDYWVYAYRGSYDGAVAVFYSNQWQNTTAAEKSYSWTYWQGHVYEEPDLHLLQWAVSKIQYKHLFSVCYANFSYVLERWVHVNLPVTGTTNTFNGFGAVTGIGWEKHGETSDATNVFDYIGSASAPDEASEPDVEYTTHTMGYDIAAVWGLISWDFNYCTNKYW